MSLTTTQKSDLSNDQKLELYRTLARVHRLDDYGMELLARGQVPLFWHSTAGHEAVGVGACSQLRVDDYLYFHYRGHGLPYLVPKGMDPKLLFAEHHGKVTGSCRGVGGIHSVAPELNVFGWSSLLGPQFGITDGYGLAAKLNGREQVAICFFGDGSAGKGQFHEGLNISALWKLPVVWVLENNGLAIMTPIEDHFAAPSGHFVELAAAYGMPTHLINGLDVEEVHHTVAEAIARAREGLGPTFIEATVDRIHGHAVGLANVRGNQQRSTEEIAEMRRRDPVARYEQRLFEDGILTQDMIQEMAAEFEEEVAAIDRFCLESANTDPTNTDFTGLTYKI